uniref:Uncharacterized protein n=1 Tax=Cacopsylla melanoneura TaxID=428564 RepID=A0A8D8ZLY5_9HEMI
MGPSMPSFISLRSMGPSFLSIRALGPSFLIYLKEVLVFCYVSLTSIGKTLNRPVYTKICYVLLVNCTVTPCISSDYGLYRVERTVHCKLYCNTLYIIRLWFV